MKKRDNGLDLLRIISMLMIVALHFWGHGGLIGGELAEGTVNWFIANAIYPFALVAVNCFVLLSGYFQCTSQFKLKRVLSVWLQAVVYSVVLYVASAVYLGNFSLSEVIRHLLVVATEQYWFVTAYLLMYMVSPFLNAMISAMDKRQHMLCCCTVLGIFCVANNLTNSYDLGNVGGGHTVLWFCVLYVVAAYIRIYMPVEKKQRKWGLLVYGLCALGVGLSRFAVFLLDAPVVTSSYNYNSILVTAAAIGLFMAMRTVNLSGKPAKLVGFFAPLAFGVYLIHDHPSIRPMLWSILKPYAFASSPWMIPYGLVCVVGVFLGCCAVEWLRQQAFRLLGISKLCDRLGDKVQSKWK